MKRLIVLAAVVSLLVIPSLTAAQQAGPRPEPETGAKVADLLLVRPLGLIVSSASTAIGIALMPIAFPIGQGEACARVFIEAPWRFTAGRPLGDFENYKDGKPITIVPDN